MAGVVKLVPGLVCLGTVVGDVVLWFEGPGCGEVVV